MRTRRLTLTPIVAMIALGVPLLAVSIADACPQSYSRYTGGAPAKDCRGQRVGPLTFSVRTSNPLLPRGDRMTTHMEVRLRAHAVGKVRRRPLNVALVLDRSGSMRGAKMRDAKEAARKMVRLLEPGDVISVISYSDTVRVDWPAKPYRIRDHRRILSTIDRMNANGSTFLEGGMREGAKQVRGWMGGNRITRVLLVSDGNANVGVRGGRALGHIARRLLHKGVATTTIGLGLDYNEDTMTAIADGGAGSYFYVRESRELESTFRDELRRMMATAARNVMVRIRPGDGVQVRTVHGYDAERGNGGAVIIPLADLSEHAERGVLIELSVPTRAYGTRRLARVDVAFADTDGRRFEATGELEVLTTDDKVRIRDAQDWTVLKRVQELRLARAMKDSAELVARGKAAEAQKRLDGVLKNADSVQRRVKDKRLGEALKKARQRYQQAPAAAAAGRSTRENYKKRAKAEAFSMSKY